MEAPITPTCKIALALTTALSLVATPAEARGLKLVLTDGRLSTYVRARTAEAIGDTATAANLYSTLARSQPGNVDMTSKAVGAAVLAGDFATATTLARTLPDDKRSLNMRLLLVADALRRDQLGEALTLVNERTEARDGGFVVPLLRAWEKKSTAPLETGEVGQSLLSPYLAEQRAFLMLARGDAQAALPLIDEALSRAGGRRASLSIALAQGLIDARDPNDAAKLLAGFNAQVKGSDLKALAVRDAGDAFSQLMTGLAISLNGDGEDDLVLSLMQVGRAAAPERSDGRLVLGLLLDDMGRHKESLAALAPVDPRNPLASEIVGQRVRQLGLLDRNADAVAEARAALAAAGSGAIADDWARLGTALADSDDHGGAADAFGRAAALAEAARAADRWTYRLLRADQLDKIGRWPEARAELRAGLAVAPNEPLLLNFLGYGQLIRGEDVDAAEAMIRKASAMRPDDASITDSLGWALYKQGRVPEAIETLRRAAAADPGQSEIGEHLGDALYSAGFRREARAAWRGALPSASKDESARMTEKLEFGLTRATAAP